MTSRVSLRTDPELVSISYDFLSSIPGTIVSAVITCFPVSKVYVLNGEICILSYNFDCIHRLSRILGVRYQPFPFVELESGNSVAGDATFAPDVPRPLCAATKLFGTPVSYLSVRLTTFVPMLHLPISTERLGFTVSN